MSCVAPSKRTGWPFSISTRPCRRAQKRRPRVVMSCTSISHGLPVVVAVCSAVSTMGRASGATSAMASSSVGCLAGSTSCKWKVWRDHVNCMLRKSTSQPPILAISPVRSSSCTLVANCSRTRYCSVTSLNTSTTPTIWPVRSRMGAALSKIWYSGPSRARSAVWLAKPTTSPLSITKRTGLMAGRRVWALMI